MLVVCEWAIQYRQQRRDVQSVVDVPVRQLREQHAIGHGRSRVRTMPERSVFERDQPIELSGSGELRGRHGTDRGGHLDLGGGVPGVRGRAILRGWNEPASHLLSRHMGPGQRSGDPMRGHERLQPGKLDDQRRHAHHGSRLQRVRRRNVQHHGERPWLHSLGELRGGKPRGEHAFGHCGSRVHGVRDGTVQHDPERGCMHGVDDVQRRLLRQQYVFLDN